MVIDFSFCKSMSQVAYVASDTPETAAIPCHYFGETVGHG